MPFFMEHNFAERSGECNYLKVLTRTKKFSPWKSLPDMLSIPMPHINVLLTQVWKVRHNRSIRVLSSHLKELNNYEWQLRCSYEKGLRSLGKIQLSSIFQRRIH